MKAIRMTQRGGPEVRHRVELPNPQPGKGELSLKVAAGATTGKVVLQP